MAKLKPCPFCGEEAHTFQLPDDDRYDLMRGWWIVGCDGKEGSLCPGYIWKMHPFYLTEAMAEEKWNNRAESMKGYTA